MEELWDEVSMLAGIRENESEIGRISSVTQQLEDHWTPITVEIQAVPTPSLIIFYD